MPPSEASETGSGSASAADLNAIFRRMYGANRDELAATVPLAAATLIGTAEISRIEHGRVVKTYPPAVEWIAAAKGLLHGLLAVQATGARLLRAREGSDGLLEAALRDANDLVPLLEQATSLAVTAFPAELAPPARRILDSVTALARRRAQAGQAVAGDMLAAMRPVEGDLKAVLDGVGEAVYASVVRSLRAFRDESRPQDWAECLLFVCGPPFGRRDSIEIAAAMEVFGREALGMRVLSVDNVFTIPAAISQVGGAIADRDLGAAVFGDPLRMWRDLLGDVARRHAGGGFFPSMGRD
jgi:hypothetical protein